MKEFNIDITTDSSFFVIKSKKFDVIPEYQRDIIRYGKDDGDSSNLVIYRDIKTCEILSIVCLKKDYAIESSYLFDYNEFADLKNKVKASYVVPKGVSDIYDFISDFTVYFSRDMLKVIFKDGEPYYSYTDGRMIIYYDDNYKILDIIIKDLTEEEYESLKKKKKGKPIILQTQKNK